MTTLMRHTQSMNGGTNRAPDNQPHWAAIGMEFLMGPSPSAVLMKPAGDGEVRSLACPFASRSLIAQAVSIPRCKSFQVAGGLERNEAKAAVRGLLSQCLKLAPCMSAISHVHFYFGEDKPGFKFIWNEAEAIGFGGDILKRLSHCVSSKSSRHSSDSGRRHGYLQLGFAVATF